MACMNKEFAVLCWLVFVFFVSLLSVTTLVPVEKTGSMLREMSSHKAQSVLVFLYWS